MPRPGTNLVKRSPRGKLDLEETLSHVLDGLDEPTHTPRLADLECDHGRLPDDRTAPCGCWPEHERT